MARMELQSIETGDLAAGVATSDMFFRLGLMYSTGRSVEPDLVAAHKWFNIAAARGHDAARVYRGEIARELTGRQIADAQRAAREWLGLN